MAVGTWFVEKKRHCFPLNFIVSPSRFRDSGGGWLGEGTFSGTASLGSEETQSLAGAERAFQKRHTRRPGAWAPPWMRVAAGKARTLGRAAGLGTVAPRGGPPAPAASTAAPGPCSSPTKARWSVFPAPWAVQAPWPPSMPRTERVGMAIGQ